MTDQKTVGAFIRKWGPGGSGYALNERQGAQQHFLELCDVLDVARPTGVNDGVTDYLFEKQMLDLGQKRGYADVFKRNAFAWEYKAPGRSLDAALSQLMRYAMPLGNPPLLIVSDRLTIEIHTHFTGRPTQKHVVALGEVTDPAKREVLRRCFDDPDSFLPTTTNKDITEAAATAFATTAERIREKGIDAQTTSHFLTQCMFCFFAEDVGLLPPRTFADLVGNARITEAQLQRSLTSLFESMRDGNPFGSSSIEWFNGGLFETIAVPALSALDVSALRNAAEKDWRSIDATIFGTLFERGLDPKKRSQLGAHYTDPATIAKLVAPVVRDPLLTEWATTKVGIMTALKKSKQQHDAAYKKANAVFTGFLEKLRNFRVLDPACGSGNFLYIALRTLKDIEHLANIEAESLGLERQVDSYTGPGNLLGIEINVHAAELARVTVWIGELQWRLQHGYPFTKNPVLQSLDQIQCCDALLTDDGLERQWPEATVIVGNPPFVGDKKMNGELGEDYVHRLRRRYEGRVPGGADLVCYWFEKSNDLIGHSGLQRAGLVATNSIRGGRNREVLKHICDASRIFAAWSDEEWVNEGAAVRVSLICFGRSDAPATLDGAPAGAIFPDLTAAGAGAATDLTRASPLVENAGVAFSGITKKGRFDLDGVSARQLLRTAGNPNGRPNSDVLFPWKNGEAVVGRDPDKWIINFGERGEVDASQYQAPFTVVESVVKPARMTSNAKGERENWWKLARRAPDMFAAIGSMDRFIVTPEVSKHRVFVWMYRGTVPDKNLAVIARSDYTSFGTLHSHAHEVWALRMGTSLEDRPRYTSSTTFRTFPFPNGLTPNVQAAEYADEPVAMLIAEAARKLVEARDRWLNPPEWIVRTNEIVAGCPDRVVAKIGHEADLKKRTLTNLYNERPAWLVNLHRDLDQAVAAAYGWEWPISDEEIVRRLFALNQDRAMDNGAQ